MAAIASAVANSVLTLLLGRQHDRILRLKFPRDDGPEAVLLPERLEADEALSRDFEYRVTLLSDDAAIPAKSLMGKMATIELVRADGSLRYFNGYVFEFGRVGTDGGMATYRMVLRPWMAFLRLRQNSGPLAEKSVEELTATILGRYEVHDYRTQLGKVPDAVLTQVMQWQETDANFQHRWWEERGWCYWYEHREDGHTLVLSDDSTLAEPIDGNPLVRYFTDGGPDDDDAIAQWTSQRRLSSTNYAVSSFDFKDPARPIQATTNTINEQGETPLLEVYEHTGAYGFPNTDSGEALAKLRMEEIEANAKHFEAQGDCSRLQPGRCFELTGHFEHDLDPADDRQFLVVAVRHLAVNNYLSDKTDQPRYENQAVVSRRKVPWRPGRGYASVMPRVYGLHTAIVVGPSGEEIDCDEYGRVLVQFHSDRVGQYDEKSYCRVRVATPMAGDRFGFVAIPRISQEVIIQFLDGHPDRPLITGLVPNQLNMPPWDLPANKTQTGFLTRSTHDGAYENANALRFEDKKGEEQLWIHAERNQDIEVEHDETHWVGNDRKKTIDRDETVYVKRDRTETVDRNETITVHNNREERVDHDERISIGDHRTEDVGKNETLFIGQNRTKTIGKSERYHIGHNKTVNIGRFKTETIGMASLQTVGMGKMTNVGMGYNRNVGMMMISVVGLNRTDKIGKTWSIAAGDKIELKVGDSQLTLTPDAIYLTAKDIHLKAENEIHLDAPKDVHLNTGAGQPAPDFEGEEADAVGVIGAAVGVAGLMGQQGDDHNRVKEENDTQAAPGGSTFGALDRSPASAGDGKETEASQEESGSGTVETGLGADVDALVAKSPSLQGDLDSLAEQGWSIDYGDAGAGSYANRQSKSIVLDRNLSGDPLATTQVLAHEVGHATYLDAPDFSSKEAYVQGALADEGAATLNNIKVQREIIAAGGSDIGINGSSANYDAYNKAYDEFVKTGDVGAARKAIGSLFGGETTSTTNQSYEDYYGGWYEENYGDGK